MRRTGRHPAVITAVCLAAALLAAAWCRPAGAAEELEATLKLEPATIARGRSAAANVIVRTVADIKRVVFPPVDGILIRRGATRHSLRQVGAQIEQYRIFVFHVTPTRTGEFTIGPALVVSESGRQYRTNPALLKAVEGGSVPSDLRVEVQVLPDPPVYVNQPLHVTFRLVTRRKIRSYMVDAPWLHKIDGFRVFDPLNMVKAWDSRSRSDMALFRVSETDTVARAYRRRAVDGATETCYELKRTYVPLASGAYKLDAPAAAAKLLESDTADLFSDPFFDGIMGQRAKTVYAEAAGEPMTWQVRALPENGRPASFTGAVGTFAMTAAVTPAEATVGGTVTLAVTISGRGSLDLAESPELPSFEGCRAFEREEAMEGDPYSEKGASRTVRVPLYMEKAGSTTIPAVKFGYFDPEAGQYVTLASEPMPVNVLPGAGGEARKASFVEGEPAPRQGVADMGRDITDIFTDVGGLSDDGPRSGALGLGILALVPAVLGVAAGMFLRLRRTRTADEASIRRRSAMANFRRGMQTGVTPALLLRRYLADITGGETGGEITPDEALRIVRSLTRDGPAGEARDMLVRLDALRFAPGEAAGGELRSEAGRLVERIDRCRT